MAKVKFPLDVLQRAQLIANRVRCHAKGDPIKQERIIAEGIMSDRAAHAFEAASQVPADGWQDVRTFLWERHDVWTGFLEQDPHDDLALKEAKAIEDMLAKLPAAPDQEGPADGK